MSNVRSLTWIGESLSNQKRKSQAPSLLHLGAHSLHLFTEHLVPARYGVRGWSCSRVRGHGACPRQFATHRVNSECKGHKDTEKKEAGRPYQGGWRNQPGEEDEEGDPSRRNGM